MARIRHDVATPTLGQDPDAETQPWHPVLDTYARGVELMRALPMDNPQSWLWAANTHRIPVGTPARPAWGLGPVHFLKISHHGSHNGTYDEPYDELMPVRALTGETGHALVSTHDGDGTACRTLTGRCPSTRRATRCTTPAPWPSGVPRDPVPRPVPDRSRTSA
jgi:hypothetical protein